VKKLFAIVLAVVFAAAICGTQSGCPKSDTKTSGGTGGTGAGGTGTGTNK
jgi:hypothetical protein